VRLGREARHVAYPVPKIVAARMGPTPKIWVRVVPETSISASMRPLRSAIFLSSVLTSRKISEARRRRRCSEEPPRARMERRMRAVRSAESLPVTPPGRDPAGARAGGLAPWCALQPGPLSSRRAGAALPSRPRDLRPQAFRCARRPKRWPGHRARRSCERCRSRAP
jgi:hypothetical protein